MRIDMKREAEVNQRKGLTRRTLLSAVWFILCLIFAYFFTGWLTSSQTLTTEMVYGDIGVPPSVGLPVVRLVTILLLVGVLQFAAVVIFAATSPAAKVRTGQPTAVAQSVDFYEKQYNRRA